jgi:uncharacterized DUF497 family protein
MFERELIRFREKVRSLEYIVTLHAEEELADDNLTVFDVEHVILTGRVIERQKDAESGEWKYVVVGDTLQRASAVVICKMSQTDKLVVITVYKVKPNGNLP